MQKSLTRIQEQIDKLQRRADAIRGKEIAGVIKRMQTAIQHYNLTPEDVFGKTTTKRKQAAVSNGHAKVASRTGRPNANPLPSSTGTTRATPGPAAAASRAGRPPTSKLAGRSATSPFRRTDRIAEARTTRCVHAAAAAGE
jgi:hypothetical protein